MRWCVRADLGRLGAMSRSTLLFAILVLSISACASARADKAKQRAAKEFNCPVDQITLKPAADRTEPGFIEGCGKQEGVLVHCIHASGTGGSASSCKVLKFSEATAQASFTTGCPKEQIETTWMKPNLGVEACGKRMIFAPSLSGWILNTASEGAEPAQPISKE
jgi:hypothetical protein